MGRVIDATDNGQLNLYEARANGGAKVTVKANASLDSDATLSIMSVASDTWNPGSIADGAEEAHEVTATGAALGDFVLASFSLDLADLQLNASVTASDTVTCVLSNSTGGAVDLASGTVKVLVIKHS